MIEAGILQSGDPVELVNGWLVQKMTLNPPHALCVSLALKELGKRLPPGWFIIAMRLSPEVLGLIDATSNNGRAAPPCEKIGIAAAATRAAADSM